MGDLPTWTAEIRQGKGGKWRFVIKDPQGETAAVAPVTGFKTGDEANEAAKRVMDNSLGLVIGAKDAEIDSLTRALDDARDRLKKASQQHIDIVFELQQEVASKNAQTFVWAILGVVTGIALGGTIAAI